MGFHMTQIGILRRQFSFVRHVNQDIKPAKIILTVDDREELLLVQFEHVLDGYTKVIQQAIVFLAAPGRGGRCDHHQRLIPKIHCP